MDSRKPAGIDERPEQLREPLIKAEGGTAAERHLAKLANRSFLNLWSYPNPFRNQKQSGKGDGKELCDLLVVCGLHVIIFSEKTIAWPPGDVDLAWRRWAKRALRDSAKQAKGAERWIAEHPDRIFLDRECKVPFPIGLPSPDERIVHRVIVARGASEACKKFRADPLGRFVIRPAICDSDHWSENAEPFAIGDIDPSGSFVHVIDEDALDIVLGELDTIRDFTDYLERKTAFVRSGRLIEAHGEENLLAYYAVRINDRGDHDFVSSSEGGDQIRIDHHHYRRLSGDLRYIAKKEADKVSYVWDALIETFTRSMLDGTSIVLGGYDYNLRKSELGVRYMALEHRFARRCHGEAVGSALQIGRAQSRFFRLMIGEAGSKGSETAFFILTLKYLDWMEEKGGYEHYRLKRTELAEVYAKGVLERFHHLKRVIGISREPLDQGRGVSEDLIYAEQSDWSDDERCAIRKDCDAYGVFQEGMKRTPWQDQEFPDVETSVVEEGWPEPLHLRMNRKQRRAAAARARKSRD